MADPTRPVPVTGYPAPNQNPNGYPPPNTAYPYAAPPPQSYPYYQPDPYYDPRRATFLRRFFAVMIATILLTGTIIFIIWLILRPRLPQFRVTTFSLTSPFNLTPNHLSTSFDLTLTARNPNSKITLYYDDVQAAVFYKRESLADTYLAPFVQGKKEESLVKGSFVAANTFVDGVIVDGIKGEGGSVGFNVRLVADVRFKAGIWRARRRLLKVYCGGLVVEVKGNVTTTGNGLSGGDKGCSVGM